MWWFRNNQIQVILPEMRMDLTVARFPVSKCQKVRRKKNGAIKCLPIEWIRKDMMARWWFACWEVIANGQKQNVKIVFQFRCSNEKEKKTFNFEGKKKQKKPLILEYVIRAFCERHVIEIFVVWVRKGQV